MGIWLIIVLLFAASNYHIASNKKRNSEFWFVMGLLFGFISTFVLLLLPKNRY